MMTQTWDDAYHQLWSHAAHHRGLREAIGELPGPTLSQSLRQWPRTSGADVVAIAAVIDPVLHAAPRETGAHGIDRAWRRCTRTLETAAFRDPTREYHHNREFWSALASIAAYLATIDAPVPEAMWQALLAELMSGEPAHRNTAVVDERLHLAAFSYDELWQAQKTALAKLRGADVRDAAPGVMGGRMTIPRTVNADVVQLATYWTNALVRVDKKRREMGPHGPDALRAAGLDGELRRWRAALADVDLYASRGDPVALYPKNDAFWRASGSLSVTVAAIDEEPSPFDMLLDTIIERPSLEYRNATYPDEGTFETRWDKQHDDFVQARGSDTRDPLPGRGGRPMKIPRTLNGEITKLASDWNAAWKKLDSRRGFFGNIPNEIGLDEQEKRWKAVMKDVNEIAEPGKVDEVYPKNHEFWRETLALANTLDVFKEAPTKFDIAIDVAKTLPDRLGDVLGKVAHALGDVAYKAGEEATKGAAKPLIIGGSVVLGGILLWRILRRPPATEAA